MKGEESMDMFCYQCEQTAKGTGCTLQGVCGKDSVTATLQDLLLHITKGLGVYAHRAREMGRTDSGVNAKTSEALFTTITNVNFHPDRVAEMIEETVLAREVARDLYEDACRERGEKPSPVPPHCVFAPAPEVGGMVDQGRAIGVLSRREKYGDDAAGLQELLTYGLKGTAAYMDHAHVLGLDDDRVSGFFHKALDALAREESDLATLTQLCLQCGEANLGAMKLLDEANTGTYGHPEPTRVRITALKGKAILVSGHDLKDLEMLLKQTEGTGINVYTHGEMLPCNAYPALKKYPHLAGNYGGAWQDQQKEFDRFPGAILMTTNCIQKPASTYIERIFTTGLVAFPGVTHIADKNFKPVIDSALESPGFTETEPEKFITIGFGRNAVLSVADQVIGAVKTGAIRHFFLVGGCDGARSGRNYYTDFAKAVPDDCVILTLACGKYRFNKLDFGDIGGIPRLLDMGQCNDAYSAIVVASALADAFGAGVNDLPLSLILSWYEQKAVAILLSLLHLGIKNIKLGPSLPACLTPNTLGVLVKNFGIAPVSTPEEDLKEILG
jgi:hydroxylamine reductase